MRINFIVRIFFGQRLKTTKKTVEKYMAFVRHLSNMLEKKMQWILMSALVISATITAQFDMTIFDCAVGLLFGFVS